VWVDGDENAGGNGGSADDDDGEHPRGAMLRAYDKHNGSRSAAVTCRAAERVANDVHARRQQYIVVAVSTIAGQNSYSGSTSPSALPN